MNQDPNAYRYKWFNGSKNFQEHLEHFVSEQKNLTYFFLCIENISIHRSKIHIYELKGKNDQLCNQLSESIVIMQFGSESDPDPDPNVSGCTAVPVWVAYHCDIALLDNLPFFDPT
ncbi:hypothetical protein EJ110_NYTH50322 [Nymphaea thermarum]|nr:hypothetical protein EJ110_NYTH50322 [Nymphaea thermarum]